MNLKQLRELANAGKEEKTNPKGRLHFHIVEFYNAITPQTILALLDLVELQHSVLEHCVIDPDISFGPAYSVWDKRQDKAFELYDTFNKEQ